MLPRDLSSARGAYLIRCDVVACISLPPVPRYVGDTDIYLTGLNFRDGPHAGVLDAVVVLAHLDPEEAHLAPVGAPAVAADPEPLPGGIVAAPAHQAHLHAVVIC